MPGAGASTTGFADRSVTMNAAPDVLVRVAGVLASRTRLRVLAVLARAREPLNINAVARRVGVDASPVRTHLGILVSAGLAREAAGPGRERRFTTTLRDARLTLEGVDRASAPEKTVTPSKTVTRLQRKLETVDRQMTRLTARAHALQRDLEAEWARLAADAADGAGRCDDGGGDDSGGRGGGASSSSR